MSFLQRRLFIVSQIHIRNAFYFPMHVSTFFLHAFCHECLKNSALNSASAFSAYDPYSAEKQLPHVCGMHTIAPSPMQRKYAMKITSTKALHFLNCL